MTRADPVSRGRGLLVCWALPLVLLLAPALTAPASAQEAFAGWPAGWVSAYQRSEAFNAARAKYNPATRLEFSPSGAVFHAVPLKTGERQNLFFVFFNAGCQVLETSLPEDSSLGQKRSQFPPGRYASCVKVSGFNGYQHLYPLVWFDVLRPPAVTADPRDADAGWRIEMIPPPEPAEDYWPNERLLQFLDFTVFPNFGLPQVLLKNERVHPDIVLQVTNAGVVVRDKIDEALEKLLRWRIYHNGKLIEKGPAGGTLRYAASEHGFGSYLILLGVDGPTGFLPVSNYLHFPLFPEKDGGFAVLPKVTNPFRYPDFLLEFLSPERLRETSGHQIPAKNDDPGYYAAETIYAIQGVETVDDEKKDTLLYLWQNWGYEVNMLKSQPKHSLNRIPLVP